MTSRDLLSCFSAVRPCPCPWDSAWDSARCCFVRSPVHVRPCAAWRWRLLSAFFAPFFSRRSALSRARKDPAYSDFPPAHFTTTLRPWLVGMGALGSSSLARTGSVGPVAAAEFKLPRRKFPNQPPDETREAGALPGARPGAGRRCRCRWLRQSGGSFRTAVEVQEVSQ